MNTTIGIIGMGNMGRSLCASLQQLDDVTIAAVAGSRDELAEKLKAPAGNIASDPVDPSAIMLYPTADDLINAEDVNAVILALPTTLHAEYTIKAMNAGLHVFCEKPMALTMADCQSMIDAQRKTKLTLQIGHCIRFWPEYTYLKNMIDSGEYGAVRVATFRRMGYAPGWGDDCWFLDDALSGGMPTDLHIHDTDFVHYLFGMPRAVTSQGTKGPWGGLGYISTRYLYESDISINAEASWIMTEPFGFEMGYTVMFENATVEYSSSASPTLKVSPAEGAVFHPDCGSGDGYTHELKHFLSSVRGEDTPALLTPEQSRDSLKIVLAEIQSAAGGKEIPI